MEETKATPMVKMGFSTEVVRSNTKTLFKRCVSCGGYFKRAKRIDFEERGRIKTLCRACWRESLALDPHTLEP